MQIDPGQNPQIDPLKHNKVQEKKGQSIATKASNPSSIINLSDNTKKLHDQVKNADSHEKVRDDMVATAKADLENWSGLKDDQIDQIMQRMIDEMSI